nr:BrnT family toxin [uncultured Sphingomonas sp.]
MECRWASERLYSLTSTWRSSPTVRIGDEEERLKAVGLVNGRLWTAIHVWRGENIRLISVRRSNGSEQEIHHRHPG